MQLFLGSDYSQCDTDDDCSLEITPSCQCYVSSTFHPYYMIHVKDLIHRNVIQISVLAKNVMRKKQQHAAQAQTGRGGTCNISQTRYLRHATRWIKARKSDPDQ